MVARARSIRRTYCRGQSGNVALFSTIVENTGGEGRILNEEGGRSAVAALVWYPRRKRTLLTTISRATAGTLALTRHSAATHDARPAVLFTACGSSHLELGRPALATLGPANGAELSKVSIS